MTDKFFTPQERETLEAICRATIDNVMEPFETIETFKEAKDAYFDQAMNGVEFLDFSLRDLSPEQEEELTDPESRELLIDTLSRLLDNPRLNLARAAYMVTTTILKPKTDLHSTLRNMNRQVSAATELVQTTMRLPLMYADLQRSEMMMESADSLHKLRQQSTFLDSLDIQDIGLGNVNRDKVRSLTRFRSPFLPTLKALENIDFYLLPLNEECTDTDYRFIPLVNDNFIGSDRYDFQGKNVIVHKEVWDAVTSIDPRIYFGLEESDNIKGTLTGLLLLADVSGQMDDELEVYQGDIKRNTEVDQEIIEICESINQGDLAEANNRVVSAIKRNCHRMTSDPLIFPPKTEMPQKVMDKLEEIRAEDPKIDAKGQALLDALQDLHSHDVGTHLKIRLDWVRQYAEKFISPDFFVRYAEMISEQRYNTPTPAPKPKPKTSGNINNSF